MSREPASTTKRTSCLIAMLMLMLMLASNAIAITPEQRRTLLDQTRELTKELDRGFDIINHPVEELIHGAMPALEGIPHLAAAVQAALLAEIALGRTAPWLLEGVISAVIFTDFASQWYENRLNHLFSQFFPAINPPTSFLPYDPTQPGGVALSFGWVNASTLEVAPSPIAIGSVFYEANVDGTFNPIGTSTNAATNFGLSYAISGFEPIIRATPLDAVGSPIFDLDGSIFRAQTILIATPIPEPRIPALLIAGGSLLVWWRRRQKAA